MESTSTKIQQDYFYTCGDLTFKCKDGDLKTSKLMLIQRTTKFDDHIKEDVVNLSENNQSTIKVFLDLLMGFEPVASDTAIRILPIACKFGVKDLADKCVDALKPTVMDENVIGILNIAVDCECEDLKDSIIDFLRTYGLTRLFSEEKYYLLLRPKSMSALLKFVFRNPIVLKSVVEWGKQYIENNKISDSLRCFFKKNRILNRLSLDCLESSNLVLELYDPSQRKTPFTKAEILNHLKKLVTKSTTNAQWLDVEAGDHITENFQLKFPIVMTQNLSFCIFFNGSVCDNFPFKENSYDYFFECTVTVIRKKLEKHTCADEVVTKLDYKILANENTGSTKSKIDINLQYGPYNLLQSVTVTYKFHKACKVLKTLAKLPQLKNNEDNNKLYFTCGLKF